MANTSFDELFLPLAVEMLNEFGKDVLISRLIPGDYDVATGTQSAIPRTFPWKIGFGKASGVRNAKFNADSALSDVVASSRFVYCAAFGIVFEPKPGDQLIMDAGTSKERAYAINLVDPTYSGQQVVLFDMLLESA